MSALNENIKKNNRDLLLYAEKKKELTRIKTELDSAINKDEYLIKRTLSNYLEKDDKKNHQCNHSP